MSPTDAFLEIESYAHLLLGRIAIECGFISYQELVEALELQHLAQQKNIGTILLEVGYLKDEQLQEILEFQKQFQMSVPCEWPYIPDTVFKALAYSACDVFANKIELGQLRRAEELREIYLMQNAPKSLGKILAEDFRTVTQEELKKFQQQIHMTLSQCPQCHRRYHLFNCEAAVTLPCPVCWDCSLIPDAAPADATIPPKSVATPPSLPPETAKRAMPKSPKAQDKRATEELKKFYEDLNKDAPAGKAIMETPAKRSLASKTRPLTSRRPPEQHTAFLAPNMESPGNDLKISADKNGQTTKAGHRNADSGQKQPEQMKAMGNTVRVALQEIYDKLERRDTKRLAKSHDRPEGELFKVTHPKDSSYTPNRQMRVRIFWIASGIILSFLFFISWWGWRVVSKPRPQTASSPSIILDVEMPQETAKIEEALPKTVHDPQTAKLEIKTSEVTSSSEVTNSQEDAGLQRVEEMLVTPTISRIILEMALQRIERLLRSYPQSRFRGDYHNWQGRILFWLVFTDEEGRLTPKQNIELLNKACEAMKIAQEDYIKPGNQTRFVFTVMPWMWEAKAEGVTPWDKHFPKFSYYFKPEKAKEDIDKYLGHLQRFLERENVYVWEK